MGKGTTGAMALLAAGLHPAHVGSGAAGRGGYAAPPWAGMRGGTHRLRGRSKGLRRLARGVDWTTVRHERHTERLRRLWQVHEGRLAGGAKNRFGLWVPFVSDEARHVAHGIVPGNVR